jgi:hypothetical protein
MDLSKVVIEVLDSEHSKKVKDFFLKNGVNQARGYKFDSTKEIGSNSRWYGLINGIFGNYSIRYIEGTGSVAKTLEELEPKSSTFVKRVLLVDAHNAFSCNEWKKTIKDFLAKFPLSKDDTDIDVSELIPKLQTEGTSEQKDYVRDVLGIIPGIVISFIKEGTPGFKIDNTSAIQIRNYGKNRDKGFWLNRSFEWSIETDESGEFCLIPTKK